MKNLKFKIWRPVLVLVLAFLPLFILPEDTCAFFRIRRPFGVRKPRIFRPPLPFHHKRVRPGEPVALEGKGVVFAQGRGRLHYQVDKGRVVVLGKGVVAIKGDPQVFAWGFGKKKEVGEWRFYAGRGILRVKGENFSLIAWGKLKTLAKGEGKVTFRGWWKVFYRGFSPSESHLEPEITLPEELKEEARPESEVE